MAVFSYQAVNDVQSQVSGTIAADTPRQARELLREQGLSVRQLSDEQVKSSGRWRLGRRSGRYATKLTSSIRELATLLGVGIPLLEALDTVVGQHKGGFGLALLSVRDQIAAGVSLADAMREQPQVFDPLCIHMVEVGENAGNLDQVLDQLADFNERYLELKDQVITALLYPAIVLAVSLGVSLFLMAVVVPMLLDNLLEAGRELPWPTRILKGMSDLVLHHGWILALVGVGSVTGLVAVMRTNAGRRFWHRTLLKMPVFGPMAQKQALARITMVISTLMKSGIVFLKAAEIAARSTSNLVLRDALNQSCKEVGAGLDIGKSLAKRSVFPPLLIQVFSVGEQTGRLEEMLDRLSINYNRQVTTMSSRLTAAISPILILFLAVVVGFILFATILPILEAGNVL